MTLKLITPPATEPVTLTEAKAHCKVEHTDDDTLITGLIIAARQQAEHLVGRPFITQTWEQVLDAFPAVEIDLGKANVLAITSVTYIDTDSAEQTMGTSTYSLDDEDTARCWLLPAADTDEWPDTLDTANAVRVRFTCGYGDADDVPEVIKLYMKLIIGKYHANREAVAVGQVTDLPGFERLLDGVRIWTP